MTVRGKAHVAQRYRVIINGIEFIIAKGDGRYSRWYVLDAAGNYLTHGTKGRHSYDAALYDAMDLAKERTPA